MPQNAGNVPRFSKFFLSDGGAEGGGRGEGAVAVPLSSKLSCCAWLCSTEYHTTVDFWNLAGLLLLHETYILIPHKNHLER